MAELQKKIVVKWKEVEKVSGTVQLEMRCKLPQSTRAGPWRLLLPLQECKMTC